MSDQDKTPERPEAEIRCEFGQSTRRTFLSRLGMASLLATTGPVTTALAQRAVKEQLPVDAQADVQKVNDDEQERTSPEHNPGRGGQGGTGGRPSNAPPKPTPKK